jgi:hypothetical protein
LINLLLTHPPAGSPDVQAVISVACKISKVLEVPDVFEEGVVDWNQPEKVDKGITPAGFDTEIDVIGHGSQGMEVIWNINTPPSSTDVACMRWTPAVIWNLSRNSQHAKHFCRFMPTCQLMFRHIFRQKVARDISALDTTAPSLDLLVDGSVIFTMEPIQHRPILVCTLRD